MSLLAKRIALSLATIGVVGALTAATSFALFSAQTDNTANTFAAGSVSLTGPQAGYTCDIGNIAPGDSVANACAFQVTYTGSLDAWIGLSTSESGPIFTNAGADTTPLAVSITDSNNAKFDPNAANQVVAEATGGSQWQDTFNISYSMPLAAGNDYQNETGTVDLMVEAVQAANNTNVAGTAPTAWQ